MNVTVPHHQKGPALSCMDYRHHHLVSHHRHRVVEEPSQRLGSGRHDESEQGHDVRNPYTVMLSAAKHLSAERDRPFAALRVTWCDGSNGQGLFTIEPCLNTLIWVSEQPPRADTSAVAAINRALRFTQTFHPERWRLP